MVSFKTGMSNFLAAAERNYAGRGKPKSTSATALCQRGDGVGVYWNALGGRILILVRGVVQLSAVDRRITLLVVWHAHFDHA